MSTGESLVWLGLVVAMLVGVLVVIWTGDPVDEGSLEAAAAGGVGGGAGTPDR